MKVEERIREAGSFFLAYGDFGMRSEICFPVEPKSKQHRDIILDICKEIGWSPITNLVFPFDQTTVKKMREFKKHVSQARRELQARSHEMFGKHKKECVARIQEIQEQHERFWSQYQQTVMLKGEKCEVGRAALKAGTEENLSKNLRRLQKARDEKKRFESEISELRSKIEATVADKERHKTWSKWIEEKQRRIANIKDHIKRIKKWVDEDRRKLSTVD